MMVLNGAGCQDADLADYEAADEDDHHGDDDSDEDDDHDDKGGGLRNLVLRTLLVQRSGRSQLDRSAGPRSCDDDSAWWRPHEQEHGPTLVVLEVGAMCHTCCLSR